jgi:hypothetical protein
VWLWQCRGLYIDEVEEMGEPGDVGTLDDMALRGLVRRDDGSAAWFPGVVS